MFKILIKFSLFCTSYMAPFAEGPDAKGWVSLGPEVKNVSESVEEEGADPSIWVVFSKELGRESFMVRFPEDPSYSYLNKEEISLSAKEGGYRLQVLKSISPTDLEERIGSLLLQPEISLAEVARPSPHVYDILYRKEGKWIAERFFLTSQHLYIFQTKNTHFHRENHQKFIASLEIQNSKN